MIIDSVKDNVMTARITHHVVVQEKEVVLDITFKTEEELGRYGNRRVLNL